MGKLLKRLIFIALFLFLNPPSFAAVFEDEIGRKVEIEGPPLRMISVAPSVTEILFALGLGEKIVGVSSYCNFPPEALRKEKVGGYITPSMEKILSLRPDLVFQTADGDLKSFVNRLAGLGIPVYITNPRSLSETLRAVLKIGEVTFSLPAAQTLVEAMRAKRVGVQERIAGRPRQRVLHAMSVDPLISSGKGTFVHDLIVLAGGENIAADAKGKHPLLSMEEVITRDPQVILLSSMLSNEPMTAQKQALARYREISAVRAGRILVIQADLILRPSPRIVDGLAEVARAIHPEAFKTGAEGPRGQGVK
ncbi:MAG: cobalamin-binding protein [Deltaproteobacteria bacterium]|nr:cobalamin-binding protein [Deltaproteobacteria bacterium]